jgi:hypothetical protein
MNVAVATAEALAPSGAVGAVSIDRRTHESRDGITRTTGFTAWTRVPDCARGFLVVDMGTSCHVRTIYTAQGCSIPGVAAF